MLAKSCKVADGRRVIKTLNPIVKMDCETAWTKRRQGISQAAGDVAPPRRLIQPRKQGNMEADSVTLRRRLQSRRRHGEQTRIPSGSSIKIVARL